MATLVRTAVPAPPAPVFVDVTGRRHRRVRRWGLILASGSLVYLPLVATAVLTGAAAPSGALPPPDHRSGVEAADQPAPPVPGELPADLDDLGPRPFEPLVRSEPDGPAPQAPAADGGPAPAPPAPAPPPTPPIATPSPTGPEPAPVPPPPPVTPSPVPTTPEPEPEPTGGWLV